MLTRTVRLVSGLSLSLLCLVGCGTNKAARELKPSPPKLGPQNLTPPSATATKKLRVGSGNLSVAPSSNGGSGHASETREIDVDKDGTPESVEVLYDESAQILYFAGEMQLPCGTDQGSQDDFVDSAAEGTGKADFLLALYLEGNPAGKPVGSGYYLLSAEAGQCGQSTSEILGCDLDVEGNESNCGSCEFDPTGANEPACK